MVTQLVGLPPGIYPMGVVDASVQKGGGQHIIDEQFTLVAKTLVSRSDFTYSNITNISPLATEYLHYLFEVPAEVETSGEVVIVEFTVGGNTYSHTVR